VHVLYQISAGQVAVSIYLKDSISFGSWTIRLLLAFNKCYLGCHIAVPNIFFMQPFALPQWVPNANKLIITCVNGFMLLAVSFWISLKLHLRGLIVNVMSFAWPKMGGTKSFNFVLGFYVEILKQQVVFFLSNFRFISHAACLKLYCLLNYYCDCTVFLDQEISLLFSTSHD